MDRKPAEVCHPGEHMDDEISSRHWYPALLAAISDVPEDIIWRIREGKQGITLAVAIGFAKAFGTSADYWMNLQRAWDERSK